jgi:hypothetical protein
MVEGALPTPVNIGQLKVKIEEARTANKNCLIWDQNGQTTTYFQYMEHLIEVGRMKVQVAMGAKTKDDVLAELRKAQCNSSRQGKFLGVDLGNSILDLKEDWKNEEIYGAAWTDHAAWRANCNEMTSAEEKKTPMGDECSMFMFNKDFNLCIISKATTQEEFEAAVKGVPHIEDFMKVVIA